MRKTCTLLLTLVLCLCMTATAFADAPAYLNVNSNGVDSPMVFEDQPQEINVVIQQAATQGDADEIWLWKYFEEEHNIKVNVEQVADGAEYKNLALSTGDFPDIMINVGITTADIVTYGQEEGMFLKIDEYIDEYMPNLKAIYDEHPEWKDAITAPDGHIYSLGGIADPEDETRNSGIHIHSKWMQELGVTEMPATLDEFIDLMRAFQKAHPEGIAFSGGYNAYNPCLILLTACGFVTSDAKGLSVGLRNGNVVFPYGDEEAYPVFLKAMSTLYSEGLMSHDFYTLTSTDVNGYVASGTAGIYTSAPWSANPAVFMDWDSPKPLTSEVNDTLIWPANMGALTCNRWTINAETKYPELCCKLADFFFNKTGLVLAFYGPMTTDEEYMYEGYTEGWYWDDEADWIVYPEILNDTEDRYGGMENPYRQQRIMLFTGVQFGDYRTFFEDVAAYAEADYQRVWSLDSLDFRHYATMVANQKPYYTEGYPNNVFFSAEVNERVVELKSVINAYVENETAKFVTGATELTEENLEKYFSGLKDLGYEEYLGYYVDYYANFTA